MTVELKPGESTAVTFTVLGPPDVGSADRRPAVARPDPGRQRMGHLGGRLPKLHPHRRLTLSSVDPVAGVPPPADPGLAAEPRLALIKFACAPES